MDASTIRLATDFRTSWGKAMRTTRTITRITAALALAAMAAACGAAQPSAKRAGTTADVDRALLHRTGSLSVIVQTDGTAAVDDAVRRLGGRITRELWIVHGFSATIPADRLGDLARTPGVTALTANRAVGVLGEPAPNAAQSVYTQAVQADKMWSAGVGGHGVTVALIDTGITASADLSGRIVPIGGGLLSGSKPCVNMSGEPDCSDSYGHGTFIAGLIAGNGASSGGTYKGVAPDAKLLSVKIAGRDGSTDVSNVLAAIQWVVSYKDTYGIKVLNLSLGTDGTQTYRTDPLNYAVERAWSSGIVVVVSAGNLGPAPRTIAKPADDPWVITVGAVDDNGTAGLGDDELPDFSSRGPTAADGIAKPDVVAPGAHLVSLRAPGSAIDTEFPSTVGGAYRKGSGTSMSTGVVSGIAALMLQAQPSMSPNRVKYALTATARGAASTDVMAVGKGVPDAYAAAYAAPAGKANQGLDRSSGMGNLDLSRGSVRVAADDPVGTVVQGTLTLQLLVFDPALYTLGLWTPLGWQLSQWQGSRWYGSRWYGSRWYGSRWYGSRWYGTEDPSSSYGTPRDGGAWLGAWE
jgi:serine protease AprX